MGPDLRRYHRVGVALEMRVSGKDRYGLPFEEGTSSMDVSRGGCSFRLWHEVEAGAELELEIFRPSAGPHPPIPFLTQGVVLRMIQKEADQHFIGVHFTGPQFPTYSSETTASA